MTKNEKDLISVISEMMNRKKIDGNPTDCYSINKRSNKDYFAESKIGNRIFSAQGKDLKEAIKNLIREIK